MKKEEIMNFYKEANINNSERGDSEINIRNESLLVI